MRNSRLSVAMVAASSVALAALTPVAASAQTGSLSSGGHISGEGYSPECQAAIEQAKEDHEAGVEEGTVGSSFMGPQELAFGILNGYGSSGMPTPPECIEEEEEAKADERWEKVPDFAKSMRGDDTTDMIFAVIGAILAVGGSLTQAAGIVATFSPEARAQIAGFLKNMGFKL